MNFSFKRIFLKGLGILLPTVLTIWLLVMAYQFVDQYIAAPINGMIRESILMTPWPQLDPAREEDQRFFADARARLDPGDKVLLMRRVLAVAKRNYLTSHPTLTTQPENAQALQGLEAHLIRVADRFEAIWDGSPTSSREKEQIDRFLMPWARAEAVKQWWTGIRVGRWQLLDLIGLAVAVVLIYMVGLIFGSFLGRRLVERGEKLLQRLPLFREVYPHVKQVTDFFVGDEQNKLQFNRVIAVEYPRKGIWSVGLVTGDPMRRIATLAGEECLTVFVPSSPTPFTGYVITVKKSDTVELDVSIDAVLKFTVSGGVILPEKQRWIVPPPDSSAEPSLVGSDALAPGPGVPEGNAVADQPSRDADCPSHTQEVH